MIRLALLIVAFPAGVWACECAAISVCERMQTAEIIFWGETVSGGLDPGENAWSGRPGSARLKVLEAFRGLDPDQEYVDVSLVFTPGMCSPMPYRLGARTLVFLNTTADGRLVDGGCASGQFAEEGSARLELVRRAFAGAPPTLAGTVIEDFRYWSSGTPVALSGADSRSATTNENGYFEFLGLDAGRYSVSADKPGYPRSPDASTRVDLDASGCAWVDLRLTLDNSVDGRVVGVYGDPVAGVGVYLLQANGEGAEDSDGDTTDRAGGFHFFGIEPGNYYLAVSPWGPGPAEPYDTSYHGGGSTREQATVINVGPTSEIEGIEISVGHRHLTRQVSVVAHWGEEVVEVGVWCRQLGHESPGSVAWLGPGRCEVLQDRPVEVILQSAQRSPFEGRRELTRKRSLWIEPGTEDVEWEVELGDQDFARERR